MKSHNHNLRSQIRLMLLRHAKSSWEDSAVPDIERPLAPRGLQAAKAMGETLAKAGLQPDLVLCSPAHRTRETWKIVSAELPIMPETRMVDALYDFGDGSNLFDAIRKLGGNAETLMLVGHNPSIEELAKALIGFGDVDLRARLENKFPTGAVAVVAFQAQGWPQLTEATGELTHFIRPKDLLRDPSA